MNNIYEIKNLTKTYSILNEHIDVLKDINLNIEEGVINFILGPSGAGKSTLLHIIGTLDRPSKGEVLFMNKSIFNMNDRELSQLRNKHIGFIFQFHYLLNDFNAIENIMLPSIFSGESQKQSREKAKYLMEKLGIYNRKKHKPNELSGGEQQRVAVARALINEPSIILADEPTGNLDTENTEFIMDIFQTFNRENNMSFIIVTHERELIKYADRIINIKDGIIIKE